MAKREFNSGRSPVNELRDLNLAGIYMHQVNLTRLEANIKNEEDDLFRTAQATYPISMVKFENSKKKKIKEELEKGNDHNTAETEYTLVVSRIKKNIERKNELNDGLANKYCNFVDIQNELKKLELEMKDLLKKKSELKKNLNATNDTLHRNFKHPDHKPTCEEF